MKKRNVFTLVLIAVLAFSLGLGTMAYYKRTFTSGNNPVRFANFTVNTDGTLDEKTVFDIPEPIAPGYANDTVHEFRIDKTGTEVPVKYDIKVITNGQAFENGPLVLTLYNKVDNDWVEMGGLEALNFEPNADVEEFKLGLKWPHREDGTDVNFEGMSGTIKIEVTATQVDLPATIVSLVDPAPITVTVGDSVTMPSTVVANMSDGTTKDVPVTWEPATIDTTTAGTKTATGTVEGYNGNVTFMVTVEEAENLDPYIEKVIHGLSWQGHHQYNIENYKNLPGTHYQLIAHLKNGNIIEMSSQVKLHQGVLYNLCSPEEIDYFDVQIGNKPVSYMPWEYIMTIENVPFEYSN